MRKALAYVLVLSLAAAFTMAARTAGADSAGVSMTDCRHGAAATLDCQAADCAAACAALPMGAAGCAPASRVSDAAEVFLAPLVALAARAPDTAPPKPLV